jgi:ATP-dependent DNA ligase
VHTNVLPDVQGSMRSAMNLPFPPPIAPMEAKHVARLPTGDAWQYEPKWDGFRAVAFRDGKELSLSSRKELPFNRYFPEIVEAVQTLAEKRLVLDGEIVIFTPDAKGLDFDALLQRIHPAESRVRRLANETPASFIAFDLLARKDRDYRPRPLRERRAMLEDVMQAAAPPLHLSPCSHDLRLATRWLEAFVVQGLDGVVAKHLDSPYRSGEREMLKVKRERTADCVVIGYRWAKDLKGEAVGSLLLGLYGPDGELWQVGFSSGFTRTARRELVKKLRPYSEGTSPEPPPGQAMMSRWTQGKDLSYEKLRPELVVEVAFDQVTGHRIRHGSRFVRWRPDKPPEQCTFEQLVQPANVDLRKLLR